MTNTHTNQTHPTLAQRAPQAVQTLRDELRARRAARAEQRRTRRELATYTTPGQIEDMLAMLDRSDAPQAEEMRTILQSNLRQHRLAG